MDFDILNEIMMGEEKIPDKEVRKDYMEEISCPFCEGVAYKFTFYERGEMRYPAPRWSGHMSESRLDEYRRKNPPYYKSAKKEWFIICPLEEVPAHKELEKIEYAKRKSDKTIPNMFLWMNAEKAQDRKRYLIELQKREKEEFGIKKAIYLVFSKRRYDVRALVPSPYEDECNEKMKKILIVGGATADNHFSE